MAYIMIRCKQDLSDKVDKAVAHESAKRGKNCPKAVWLRTCIEEKADEQLAKRERKERGK